MEPVLRQPEVCSLTGYGRQRIWELERAGAFPKRIRVGANRVVWDRTEVEAWLLSRPRGMTSA